VTRRVATPEEVGALLAQAGRGPTGLPPAAGPRPFVGGDDDPTVRTSDVPFETMRTDEMAEVVAFTGPTLAQRVFGRWLSRKGVTK
jgi:hypothetical protein